MVKLAAYYRRTAAEGRQLVGVERDVTVRIGRAVVTGRVDRLERTADGAQYIVDLKTGRTPVPDERRSRPTRSSASTSWPSRRAASTASPPVDAPAASWSCSAVRGSSCPSGSQPPLPRRPDDPELGPRAARRRSPTAWPAPSFVAPAGAALPQLPGPDLAARSSPRAGAVTS